MLLWYHLTARPDAVYPDPVSNKWRTIMGNDGNIETVKRMWGLDEVRDATASMRICVLDQDVENAVPHDFDQCALAQAVMRMYGSRKVKFFKSTCYFDMVDPDTQKRFVERYLLNNDIGKKIVHFDRTGEFPVGGFILSAPYGCKKLGACQERKVASGKLREYQSNARKKRREATIKGQRNITGSIDGVLEEVRNGRGMVSFSKSVLA